MPTMHNGENDPRRSARDVDSDADDDEGVPDWAARPGKGAVIGVGFVRAVTPEEVRKLLPRPPEPEPAAVQPSPVPQMPQAVAQGAGPQPTMNGQVSMNGASIGGGGGGGVAQPNAASPTSAAVLPTSLPNSAMDLDNSIAGPTEADDDGDDDDQGDDDEDDGDDDEGDDDDDEADADGDGDEDEGDEGKQQDAAVPAVVTEQTRNAEVSNQPAHLQPTSEAQASVDASAAAAVPAPLPVQEDQAASAPLADESMADVLAGDETFATANEETRGDAMMLDAQNPPAVPAPAANPTDALSSVMPTEGQAMQPTEAVAAPPPSEALETAPPPDALPAIAATRTAPTDIGEQPFTQPPSSAAQGT